MRYARDQQVEVLIDRNNLHYPWQRYNPITYWQWTPAVVTHYYDNPPRVDCLVASHPFVQFPVHFSSWQTTRKIDIANVRPLEADVAAGFGV